MTDYDVALSDLRAQMARMDDARERLRRAKADLGQVRDQTELAVMRAGAARWKDEQPFPLALVRELYWDHPEIRVTPIGHAFGMRPAEVCRHVGPDTRTVECRGGCGRQVQRDIQSRTDALCRSWYAPEDPNMCSSCREGALRKRKESHAWWDRECARMEEEAKREEEALRRAIASGLRPESVSAVFPGFDGEWPVNPAGVAVRLEP